jgi:GNAT superfamily N-acetyltransferase
MKVSESLQTTSRARSSGSATSNAPGDRARGRQRGIRGLVRRAAGTAFGSYQLNRIYALALPAQFTSPRPAGLEIGPILHPEALRDHPDFGISRTSSYGGHGAWGYGAWCEGELAAVCWVWSSERCGNAVVSLGPSERALVEIYTRPEFRGRAIAPALIACAATDAAQAGCTRLFAWIWWTNSQSIRAFEKSGWCYKDFAFSLRLLGRTLAGTWARKPDGRDGPAASR